ncbi:hypothetical protein [Corynebacterium poyangense]|uniref:hypothetical protein n=1 Tax=Corynebacterium poyangense TaxID=2684405 RepID=UPI0021CD1941|nr:hypothetical protein [Corynebacterium poyangense]
MAEIGDWTSIVDATAANGRNSFYATPEEVFIILTAIKESKQIIPGRLHGGFQDLPDNWDPAIITEEIFADTDPISAMMEVLLRPSGKWPTRGNSENT